MNFGKAFEAMKNGARVKLPNWAGWWAWENDTIIMHTKDGEAIDLLDTKRPEYTFSNMASDDFMIADEENAPVLGGRAKMSFGDALKLVKRGMGMRLPQWKEDVVIRMWRPKCTLETVAEAVHNAWWKEKKKQGVTDHPDMIPYSDLTEDVKEYDRVTANATIEAMNYMTAPYLYVESRFGCVPWKETMIELLSEEWEVVD